MEGRQIQILTLISVGLFFSWLSVGLRCYTRIVVSRTFGSDDYWIIIGMVAYTVDSIFAYIGIYYGIGVHAAQLTYDQLINAAKYQVLVEIGYILCTAIIKTSVGLLLLRITSVKTFYKYVIWISLAIIWIWTIVTFVISCVQCRPLKASWDPLTPGVCLEPRIITNFAYAISAETIFFDWLFALLPIPMLWDIKMSLRLKCSIMVILSLGIVASAATIIRVKYLVAFLNVTDALYSITPVFIWSTIEIALGIIAASTATLRPLLRSWKLLGFSSEHDSDTEPGGPRSGSWSGFKRTPRGGSDLTTSHQSNELTLGDTIHAQSPNLKTVTSWSGRSGHSEEGILRSPNERSADNERKGEGENEEYELASRPDEGIVRRTEIQIEYDERMNYLGRDMV
ncbi:hypothetical protein BELL_0743g00050 [Botrytis elliptica]|uniref:Rhodopsin domain-containing protein n=1 Tax=Botrytis elliptica TaxID=278938 RepID=A0A4Z1JFH7_9HELO|nr:hypothetical protein EAE99_012086 [Botrytis elliptica]TGO70092.1 hypothetical protein BELL_0743g00050 [Botrytis elliptica]